MKLAIVGSRSFSDYDMLCRVVAKVYEPIDEIVSGGARGADTLAKRYALENDIKYTEFPADWQMYGKKAGYIRNHAIVGNSDNMIAFWDGKSRGTMHSITLAQNADIPVYVKRF